MFTFAARDLGQPAYLSKVYELLSAGEGVLAVEVVRFGANGQEGVHEATTCEPNEWLSLDKANIKFNGGLS